MTAIIAAVSWIAANLGSIGAIVGGLLSVASLITALTPGKKDDNVVKSIAGFLSFLTHKNTTGTLKVPGTKAPVPEDEPLVTSRTEDDGKGGKSHMVL